MAEKNGDMRSLNKNGKLRINAIEKYIQSEHDAPFVGICFPVARFIGLP
jgi:hypothetical protein